MPFFSSVEGNFGVNSKAQKQKFIATGGSISQATISGTTYKIHKFTTSGTFQILSGKSNVEYLVIAGGGSGGGPNTNFGGSGGGGGAGGLLQGSVSNVTPASYSVTVGDGGSSVPSNGGTSSISSIVSTSGGGHGGRGDGVYNGNSGGSGGGGGRGTAGGTGVAGPPRQGYNGGSQFGASWGSAAGGGAGGNGGDGGGDLSSVPGGASVTINFDGTSTEYARGGAGGTRDGGGATHLGVNTGAGGGGGNAGRSGIVIIRYIV